MHVNDLDYGRIKVPVQEKHFRKIETKNNIRITLRCTVMKIG